MPYNWRFSPDYYDRSRNVLETALRNVSAYKSWQVFDPGPEYTINARYVAMPALTKKDIMEYFPQGLVPGECDVKYGLANGEIEFVKTKDFPLSWKYWPTYFFEKLRKTKRGL